MKKNQNYFLLALICCLSLFYSCNNDEINSSNEFWVPAEFETQSAVWLASPTTDYKNGWHLLDAHSYMIKELVSSATPLEINYSFNSQDDVNNLKNALLARGISNAVIESKINFHEAYHGDLWVRDTGGTYMRNKKGDYKVIDFDFDDYRMKNYVSPEVHAIYQLDNDVSHRMAAAINVPVEVSTLITEGGNLHFNGKGTLIAIEKSLLESNPGMTKAQIIDELKRVFNLKKVILLPRNLPNDSHPVNQSPFHFGNTTVFNLGVNHIDELISWKDSKTVFLPKVAPSRLVNPDPMTFLANEVLEEAYQILSNETDQDGHHLTIIRTPEPGPILVDLVPGDLMYDFLAGLTGIQGFPTDGSSIKFALAASYMNYVIANDVILIAKLYKPTEIYW